MMSVSKSDDVGREVCAKNDCCSGANPQLRDDGCQSTEGTPTDRLDRGGKEPQYGSSKPTSKNCEKGCCSAQKPVEARQQNAPSCCEGKPSPCCDSSCIDRIALRECRDGKIVTLSSANTGNSKFYSSLSDLKFQR
jgi:Cu2+-exporting ATPase